jgi:putative membrane protein
MNFLIRVAITALALWLVSLIIPRNFVIADDGTALGTLLAVLLLGLIFTIINAVIKPVIKVVAFPIFLLTLGLVSIFLYGLLLWLLTWVTGPGGWFSGSVWGLEIHGGFWWYVLAGLLFALLQVGIGAFAKRGEN